MSSSQRDEALQENMTLVIESARAIGCRVDDDSIEKVLAKDPQTIQDFLVDLIRVSADLTQSCIFIINTFMHIH